MERVFSREFLNNGILDIKVGYANGIPICENVNYEKVCTSKTGFAEAIQISYEPSKLSLAAILDIFFRMHDPTTVNHQGGDMGSQYRSVIMTHSDEELILVLEARDRFQRDWYPNHKIVTIFEPIKIWYDAEDYHQQYLDKNPGGYECSTHFIRQTPKA